MERNRYEKVWRLMEQSHLEVLIATHFGNVLYLSGFGTLLGQGYAPFGGVLIVPYRQDPVLLVPWIEYEVARRESVLKDIQFFTPYPIYIGGKFTTAQGREERVANILKEQGLQPSRIGLEMEFISAVSYERFKQAFPGTELVDASELIFNARSIKTEEEIGRIKQAAEIASTAALEARSCLRPGISETEIAAVISSTIYRRGAQFSHLVVASGERSTLPHGLPTTRKLKEGDLVVMDFGVFYENYWAEVCRTYVVGTPTNRQRELFNLVREAQKRAAAALRPGAKASDVDRAARSWLIEQGYGEYFIHSTGHGLGLGEGDAPFITPNNKATIHENMVISLEPGLYLAKEGIGIRLEDAFLVHRDGAERLTSAPQTL